jgi:cysteine desulfurase
MTDSAPRSVYLDYAATTPVDPRVLEVMLPFMTERFGNPNSLYALGRDAYRALEAARESVAASVHAANASEIVFTGAGTEGDNAAVLGIARAGKARGKGDHVIVSSFEHHAVLEPAHYLAKNGFDVTELRPREDGIIHPEDLAAALRDTTVLVSVMHANNEIGTVQPVKELAALAHEKDGYFHTDAIQAVGKVDWDAVDLGIDAASFSAHKVYGPKGVGALYLKRGTPFEPFMMGGGQESKKRSATQNVGGATALARALEIMEEERAVETPRLTALRDRVIDGILQMPNTALNGGRDVPRLPGTANLVIKGIEGEAMLLKLDNKGIAVSTGSACSSGSLEPSHVLLSIGLPAEIAHGSIRVTVGRFTTADDVEYLLTELKPVVERLRAMSPVYSRMFGATA